MNRLFGRRLVQDQAINSRPYCAKYGSFSLLVMQITQDATPIFPPVYGMIHQPYVWEPREEVLPTTGHYHGQCVVLVKNE